MCTRAPPWNKNDVTFLDTRMGKLNCGLAVRKNFASCHTSEKSGRCTWLFALVKYEIPNMVGTAATPLFFHRFWLEPKTADENKQRDNLCFASNAAYVRCSRKEWQKQRKPRSLTYWMSESLVSCSRSRSNQAPASSTSGRCSAELPCWSAFCLPLSSGSILSPGME